MKHLGKYILLLAFFTSCMLFFVHQQITIIQCSYRINQSERALSTLKEKQKKLKFQLASFTSPSTLNQRLAAADIDLVFPNEITVVKIPTVLPTPLTLVDSGAGRSADQFNLLSVLGFEKEAQADVLH